MIAETVAKFTALAREKADHVRVSPVPVAVGAMMAGAYIGIGVILALSVGSTASAAYRPLLMGLVFEIALVLVVFTGYALYMTFGLLGRTVRWREVLGAWVYVWIGNLAGALVLAALFTADGDGTLLAGQQPYLFDYVAHKTDAAPVQLFCRAALCNWLVCLAIWTAARIQNEAAKLIVIAWCLLAFVTSGFEHCVANMTAFGLALFAGPAAAAPHLLAGAAYNLAVVTLGNLAGGSLFVAVEYAVVARSDLRRTPQAARSAPQPTSTLAPLPARTLAR